MEVFALSLKIKEEGAATVQAATKKLNAELDRTAQASQVAGKNLQTAQLNAAKGSLAFGQMARSMAETGNAASMMSGGIVEAGTHIATFLGPQGILLMAVTGLVIAVRNAFTTIREDVLKEQQGMIADTRRLFGQMSALGTETSRETLTQALTQISRGQLFVIGEQALRLLPESERQSALAERGLVRLREEYARLQDELSNARAELTRLGMIPAVERSEAQRNAITRANESIRTGTPLLGAYVNEIDRLQRLADIANARLSQLPVAVETVTAAAVQARPVLPRAGTAAATGLGLPSSAELAAQFRPQIQSLTGGATAAAAQEVLQLEQQLRETFAESIGNSIGDGIAAGFERGLATGKIGEGFKALAGTMLSGLGSAMIQFGQASLIAGEFMDKIKNALAEMSPKKAIAYSLLMIAAGGALRGVASRAFGGMGGGGGIPVTPTTQFGIPMTATGPTQLIFGATSATTAAGMTPRQAVNVTLIGPNDPTAQRAMQELLRNANQRGTLG